MLGVVLASSPAILSMVHHHADFYQDLSDPVALLRDPDPQTRMRRYWAYASDGQARPGGLDAAQVSDYSRLMADSQPLVAQQVLDAYDFRGHRSLLDIGGGLGRFVSAVGHAHPHLELALVDLPAVAEQATAAMANDAKLRGRVVCHGADFFRDPLPSGADLVSLVRVLYDHPDDRVLALLRRARGCFGAAGGRILIAEPMAGTVGAQAMGDGYFGFYLLAMGGGRARSAAELIELLGEAGFVRGRALQTDLPLQTGLVVAEAAALQ
jgi:demethylspheroidene O-methyltransferase